MREYFLSESFSLSLSVQFNRCDRRNSSQVKSVCEKAYIVVFEYS